MNTITITGMTGGRLTTDANGIAPVQSLTVAFDSSWEIFADNFSADDQHIVLYVSECSLDGKRLQVKAYEATDFDPIDIYLVGVAETVQFMLKVGRLPLISSVPIPMLDGGGADPEMEVGDDGLESALSVDEVKDLLKHGHKVTAKIIVGDTSTYAEAVTGSDGNPLFVLWDATNGVSPIVKVTDGDWELIAPEADVEPR